MNETVLFNPSDQLASALLQQLEAPTTVSALSATLGLTFVQLDALFIQLNNDLVAVSDQEIAFIEQTGEEVWQAVNINSAVRQKLARRFFLRATQAAALAYHFFNAQRESPTDYGRRHHLDPIAFHAALRALPATLTQLGFTTTLGLQQDPELTIRARLFQLYDAVFGGGQAPFAALDDEIETLLTLAEGVLKPLRPTQQAKLRLYLKLWLKRLRNGAFLTPASLPSLVLPDNSRTFLVQVRARLQGLVDLPASELDGLYYFLSAQNLIASDADQLIQMFPAAERLTQQLLAQLHQADLNPSPALIIALRQVNIQALSFNLAPPVALDAAKVAFFQALYPTFDRQVQTWLATLHHEGLLPPLRAARLDLYYQYLFALINTQAEAQTADRLQICVDFAQGDAYTTYIQQTLTAFDHANFAVTTTLTAATDLYLSDRPASDLATRQLIWQVPPTPADWEALAELTLTLKQTKAAAQKR